MKKVNGKVKGGLFGIEEVMKNLNAEVAAIQGKTMKGLILAAIIIRRSMEDNSPKVPIDLGNLRASFFTVTSTGNGGVKKGGDFKGKVAGKMASEHAVVLAEQQSEALSNDFPLLILGFTANYAIFVHENMEANFQKKGRRPGAGPKFFEEALSRNQKEIVKIIASNVKIK